MLSPGEAGQSRRGVSWMGAAKQGPARYGEAVLAGLGALLMGIAWLGSAVKAGRVVDGRSKAGSGAVWLGGQGMALHRLGGGAVFAGYGVDGYDMARQFRQRTARPGLGGSLGMARRGIGGHGQAWLGRAVEAWGRRSWLGEGCAARQLRSGMVQRGIGCIAGYGGLGMARRVGAFLVESR